MTRSTLSTLVPTHNLSSCHFDISEEKKDDEAKLESGGYEADNIRLVSENQQLLRENEKLWRTIVTMRKLLARDAKEKITRRRAELEARRQSALNC